MRVGMGDPGQRTLPIIPGRFSKDEKAILDELRDKCAESGKTFLTPSDTAMNVKRES